MWRLFVLSTDSGGDQVGVVGSLDRQSGRSRSLAASGLSKKQQVRRLGAVDVRRRRLGCALRLWLSPTAQPADERPGYTIAMTEPTAPAAWASVLTVSRTPAMSRLTFAFHHQVEFVAMFAQSS
jgi:hypothetical protein